MDQPVEGPIKLWHTKDQKEQFETYADMFAIIKTTEKLERQYVRDSIAADDYARLCDRLISQFRTLYGTVKHQIPDLQVFMDQYGMNCPMAVERLLKVGVPANVQYSSATGGASKDGAAIAEAVESFITLMDSIKLKLVSMDQLYPYTKDLYHKVQQVTNLSKDFAERTKVQEWHRIMNNRAAHEELSDEEQRQFLFDLEKAYAEFMSEVRR